MTLLINDAEKLSAFRRGERSVLTEIYLTYVDEVAVLVRRGFVYSRDKVFSVQGVSDEAQQFDLVQETFARAFSEKTRHAYDGNTPYRLYLFRITKNLMIDRCRSLGREPIHSPNNAACDIDDLLENRGAFLPENPAIVAHRRRQQQTVAAFVSTLSESEMQFYNKRYVLGFSQQKTADVLQMSRRHIRTLEKRLLKGLKTHLKKNGLWP